MTLEPETVVEALASVLCGPAALHEPTFAGNEWNYVKDHSGSDGSQTSIPGICDECFKEQKPSEGYYCPHNNTTGGRLSTSPTHTPLED